MKRETIRYALYLLLPIFFLGFLGLTAPVRCEEPQKDKTAQVEVRLSEYKVEMPKTLPAGPTKFLVHNVGNKTHSFKIEGPGIDQLLSAPIKPQETGTLEVTLKPGEYKVYCPIGSHSIKGMTMTLTVTEKPGG